MEDKYRANLRRRLGNLNDCLPREARENLLELANMVKTAYLLSQGEDEGRASRWKVKADKLGKELAIAVDSALNASKC